MTQRKCGTCRFYEAGTQHGWCRNPAYPRRDDGALLRPDELGCRAGWGKDYWAAASGVDGSAEPAAFDADAAPTQPLPHVAGGSPALPAANLVMAASTTATTAVTKSRRGFQGSAVTPNNGTMQPVSAAKDDGVKRDTTLEGHPELNEQGIPYRNSSKRSPVAEAHRRALERREKERVAKEERDRLLAKERESAAPIPTPALPTPEPTPRPPLLGALPPVNLRPIPIKAEGEKLTLAPLPEARSRQEPRPAMMPKPAPTVTPEPASATPPVVEEAVDRVIQNADSVVVESPREILTPIPPAPADAVPTQSMTLETPPVKRPGRMPLPSNELPSIRSPHLAAPAEPEVGESASPPRYWNDVQPGGRYKRMELPSLRENEQRAEQQRHVQPIERPLPPSAPTERVVPQRGIRTLEEAKNGVPASMSTTPIDAPRVEPPRPVVEKRPVAAPPPVPEVAPREIDEALLRQLETNWRTQELAAHVGQRCGNCRFFRPRDGGNGSCGCSFSNAYEQQTGPQDLSCLDGIGTWWAATDEGWLERTERRPRRATPLLDALLREREEELARSMPERRRSAR